MSQNGRHLESNTILQDLNFQHNPYIFQCNTHKHLIAICEISGCCSSEYENYDLLGFSAI